MCIIATASQLSLDLLLQSTVFFVSAARVVFFFFQRPQKKKKNPLLKALRYLSVFLRIKIKVFIATYKILDELVPFHVSDFIILSTYTRHVSS